MNWLIYFSMAIFSLMALVYYKVKKTYRLFEDRKIPYVKPKFLLGSDPDGVLFRKHIGDSWDKMYKELEGKPVGGLFQTVLPFLMIRDPEYVRQVLASSFDHFFDRNFLVDEETNPLDAHLFLLRGNRWRFLRNKLSPIFSSGKLRWMFDEMDKCGDEFMVLMEKLADGKDRDMIDELARYSTDVIESCIFGLEGDSIKNPNSKMRQLGRELFDSSKLSLTQIGFVLRFSVPRLLIWLKVPSLPSHVSDYFCSTMSSVLEHRRKTGFQRKDFVQLLLQLEDKDVVEIDTNVARNENENGEDDVTGKIEITDRLLMAQTYVFFVAGFDTTSRTLHFLTYLLAENPEIQGRARQEVLNVKAKHGRFSYDALKEMKFLGKCISETLRMYPPVPMLNRECTKDFTFPDGTVVKKGEQIAIPIFSLQRDAKYFPDPLRYNPDRFDSVPERGTFLPFGDGPRACIGKRFAIAEIKVVMARILEKYRFEKSSLNAEKVEIAPWSFMVTPKNGLWLKIHKLNGCK